MSEGTNNYNQQEDIFSKTSQPTLFDLTASGTKKVEVRFSMEETSNDGGLLLLNEIDNQIGLIDKLSGCISDDRHQSYVTHSIPSMLRQRIMQIAAGYEDANDCNTLKNDEILKVCAKVQQTLATQPTMSRVENQVGQK